MHPYTTHYVRGALGTDGVSVKEEPNSILGERLLLCCTVQGVCSYCIYIAGLHAIQRSASWLQERLQHTSQRPRASWTSDSAVRGALFTIMQCNEQPRMSAHLTISTKHLGHLGVWFNLQCRVRGGGGCATLYMLYRAQSPRAGHSSQPLGVPQSSRASAP